MLAPEVSFSIYGERGVIDILAWHPGRRALLIIELKTDIVDVNDLAGSADRRRRLAPKIVAERGWDPVTVSVWVIVAPGRTNRRRVAATSGDAPSGIPGGRARDRARGSATRSRPYPHSRSGQMCLERTFGPLLLRRAGLRRLAGARDVPEFVLCLRPMNNWPTRWVRKLASDPAQRSGDARMANCRAGCRQNHSSGENLASNAGGRAVTGSASRRRRSGRPR